jgi:hypothetical protein
VFVVSQVDSEGYVLADKYIQAVKVWYTEDSLQAIVERLAPNCITGANALAKGRYKDRQI